MIQPLDCSSMGLLLTPVGHGYIYIYLFLIILPESWKTCLFTLMLKCYRNYSYRGLMEIKLETLSF